MKNLISFQLFEQVYLNDVNPFAKDNSHPKGLRFVNKEEALKSIRRLQDMLSKGQIKTKDAIIACYIMSQRAESHKFQTKEIKEGGQIWKNLLTELKNREELS
jgi:hypothetical protein